jgi:ribonuclease BN (tRNA processing enzyme)
VHELPCRVAFCEAAASAWRIGPATVRAQPVCHRGPTLGYRVEDGDTSLCYLPDPEPARDVSLQAAEERWISGLALAAGADLLIHDAQYTDDEYRAHVGWGQSSVSDALAFARRAAVRRLLLFHHDPLHSDDVLDAIATDASARWEAAGGRAGAVQLAFERLEVDVAPATRPRPAP